MIARVIRIGMWLIVGVLAIAPPAGATSLSIGAPSDVTVRQDNTRALYASDARGRTVLIAEIDTLSPDGGQFVELGVPSMAPDGRVLFGAETIDKHKHHHWGIFIGNANLPEQHRVTVAFGDDAASPGCTPVFRGDPYPTADETSSIAFTAREAGGHDALFYYSEGKLSCLGRVGDQTDRGNLVTILGFGTAQMGNHGEVVSLGFLQGERQTVLMVSKAGFKEIAAEKETTPGHAIYGHGFGLPAAVASSEGTMIAFTDKTSSGTALFLYRGGKAARILPSGTVTPLGPVSYLSAGRPGLSPDGTTAVLAGCARVPAIFRIEHGHLDLSLQRGQVSPLGAQLISFGDPSLTAAGVMYLGAIDERDQERLYTLDAENGLAELGASPIYSIAFNSVPPPPHSIFTGTLTVNQHGDFAYLGGK